MYTECIASFSGSTPSFLLQRDVYESNEKLGEEPGSEATELYVVYMYLYFDPDYLPVTAQS